MLGEVGMLEELCRCGDPVAVCGCCGMGYAQQQQRRRAANMVVLPLRCSSWETSPLLPATVACGPGFARLPCGAEAGQAGQSSDDDNELRSQQGTAAAPKKGKKRVPGSARKRERFMKFLEQIKVQIARDPYSVDLDSLPLPNGSGSAKDNAMNAKYKRKVTALVNEAQDTAAAAAARAVAPRPARSGWSLPESSTASPLRLAELVTQARVHSSTMANPCMRLIETSTVT
eukprot:TRINITY_DN25751_c0_g1_i1.p1 TRINITY_DN25751_c0_g1~~TRINITY_DN25751_c0_g1_i1.p1  ORF type:complete len:230 (-),score=53.36 TRINITY_DN25751_c0_g1_i1:91-780(-)